MARAKSSLDTAKAARAAFAGALAHDVKNSTNEIIGRLDPALHVFRRPEIGGKFAVAAANLVRANVRAMMMNSIAMSINALFMETDHKDRLGRRTFPKANIEQFWISILRLLLEIRILKEGLDDDRKDDAHRFRLVLAPSLTAAAEFHDSVINAMPSSMQYPADWAVEPALDLDDLFHDAMQALNYSKGTREALTDTRVGIALAMLTEIVSNIRFNRSLKNVSYARDMIIAYDFRWDGDFPEVYLQQMHWEGVSEGWKPPADVPQGIRRTLSLFGPKASALNFMTVDIARDSMCRHGATAPDGAPGHLCAYALRVGLKLLKAE